MSCVACMCRCMQCESGSDGSRIGKSKLESLLGCQISQYVRLVSTPFLSYKVKIRECGVDLAVEVGKSSGCFVAKWCDKQVASHHSNTVSSGCGPTLSRKPRPYLNISCWNCCGLSSSLRVYVRVALRSSFFLSIGSGHTRCTS